MKYEKAFGPQRLYSMQNSIATNSNSIVHNDIAPINAKIVRNKSGKNVAITTNEKMIKIAALISTKAEYLRRLEQVDVRQIPSAMLPHLALRIAVTTKRIIAKTSTKGSVGRTYGIKP